MSPDAILLILTTEFKKINPKKTGKHCVLQIQSQKMNKSGKFPFVANPIPLQGRCAQILENLHSISRNSAFLTNALMQTHSRSKGRHSRQTVGGKTDLARVRCQTKGKEFIGPAAQRPAEDDEEYFTGPLMGGGFCPFSRHFRLKP